MAAPTLSAKLSAFGCGAAIALVALASFQDTSAAVSTRTVHTCAAADGTLRVTSPAVPCAPDERRVRLRLVKQDPECKEDDDRAARLERRLKDLEARDRRGTLRGRRVVAPFEVITKKDEKAVRLLRIEERNVTFYNGVGKPVVWIIADASGGYLQVQTVGGDRTVGIGALDKRSHVLVQERDRDRIDLGRRANGRYGVLVSGSQGNVVAGVGQSLAGSGLAMVADSTGATAARMNVDMGRGWLAVSNAKGTEVGTLSASGPGGAGVFELGDATGAPMVQAGVNPDGAGVVRAGPGMRHSGVGIVGLVPSFILGKPK